MKRPATGVVFALLLGLIMAFGLPATPAIAAPTATPRDFDKLAPQGELQPDAVKADSAILVDSRTGNVLFEKDADTKRYPASTTKIMTCLVALEKGNLEDMVTIGTVPTLESGAELIGLKKGQTIKLEDLIYGLMLFSGNDAANAIAEHVGGSIEGFVDMMNAKAQELGMTNTHYVTTNGLHDDEHYTTARDMAKLAMAAYQNAKFREIVGTYQYPIPEILISKTDKNPVTKWTNTNKLISKKSDEIYAYEYATGGKTGYTSKAWQCLVSFATKDNTDLVSVVLHDEGKTDKWTDSITMFEYGFSFYSTLDLSALMSQQTVTVDVPNAAADDQGQGKLEAKLVPQSAVYITDRKDTIEKLSTDITQYEQKLDIPQDFSAPVAQDQKIGTVTFSRNGEALLTCDLTASREVAAAQNVKPTPTPQAVESASPDESLAPDDAVKPATGSGMAGAWLLGVGIVLALMALALFAIRAWNMSRRKSRRRSYSSPQPSSKRANTRRRR